MVLSISTNTLLDRLAEFTRAHLDDGWVAEPPAARAALLVREEIQRWTQSAYPGSTCVPGALEKDSRRGLTLTVHSAPVTHRVEIWGLACGDEREAKLAPSAHAPHSWVILAHSGPDCRAIEAAEAALKSAGLRRVERRDGALTLSLWMGSAAPDGCPACLGTKK